MKGIYQTIYHLKSSVKHIFKNRVTKSPNFFYPEPLQKLISLYGDNSDLNPSILLLGDSVFERISRDDIDKNSFSDVMLRKLRQKYTADCIVHSAYNSMMYYYLILALSALKSKPQLIIFPINIRSFSPQWDLHPLWQFNDDIIKIRKFIGTRSNNPVNSDDIKFLKRMDHSDYNKTNVEYPLSTFDKIGEFERLIESKPQTEYEKMERYKQIFIFHYLYKLKNDNRKLIYLGKLIEAIKKFDIRFYIYFTPVNYLAGKKLIGGKFQKKLKENIDFVKKFIKSHKIRSKDGVLTDYSTLLNSNYFFNSFNATEHLNEYGRKILAEKIIQDILSKKSLLL